MDFRIDINTFVIVVGFIGGYYAMKNDMANVKEDIRVIKKLLNGEKGDNGISGRLIKLEERFKGWLESHHG